MAIIYKLVPKLNEEDMPMIQNQIKKSIIFALK